jgi:hypothetical protein
MCCYLFRICAFYKRISTVVTSKIETGLGHLCGSHSSNLNCQYNRTKIKKVLIFFAFLQSVASKPNCNVVATHDDYSLISKLPKDRTSVVTILRDPIERVFSTYEFAIEVAARFLVHPNLTSALETSNRVRRKSSTMVSTLDIWPWKYLVPWMREDLFARVTINLYEIYIIF